MSNSYSRHLYSCNTYTNVNRILTPLIYNHREQPNENLWKFIYIYKTHILAPKTILHGATNFAAHKLNFPAFFSSADCCNEPAAKSLVLALITHLTLTDPQSRLAVFVLAITGPVCIYRIRSSTRCGLTTGVMHVLKCATVIHGLHTHTHRQQHTHMYLCTHARSVAPKKTAALITKRTDLCTLTSVYPAVTRI